MHDVTFIINDTGRGMTAEQLTKLGTQFYQTNYQNPGSGLGIYIVNRILDVFGSELNIQSSPGAGTTFSFTIRFTAITESHEPMMFEYAPELLKSDAEKVLVVDDNVINIEILTAQLQMGGFSVTSCVSGQECVDFCKKSDEFDVILMDMMMPGMDGLETARVLRNMNISKPIIAISAANEQFTDRFTEKVNGLQLIQESLNKPFIASQINQVIHAVCKSQN
ncbi:MAG: Sensor protein EvgS [Glaciecola sp. HTCC2999]|jgi:CheY-like chemotaxis protein|nr:MAG: Sensor protein EvgS [Glaciecola sp. HTCC2999]